MGFSFDVNDAIKYGVNEAVLIHFLQVCLFDHKSRSENYHEGKTWVRMSYDEMSRSLPFWKPKRIRGIVKSLEEQGVLIQGSFNDSRLDRTKWYTFA